MSACGDERFQLQPLKVMAQMSFPFAVTSMLHHASMDRVELDIAAAWRVAAYINVGIFPLDPTKQQYWRVFGEPRKSAIIPYDLGPSWERQGGTHMPYVHRRYVGGIPGLCVMLCLAVLPGGGNAASRYTSINVNGGGAYPYSINDAGAVTGSYSGSQYYQGFVRTADGKVSTIDPAGSTDVWPKRINATGEIAGYYQTGDNSSYQHGFVRAADGTITSFDPTGSISTLAYGLSDKSVAVGTWFDSNNVQHAFLRSAKGTITSFDVSGAIATVAETINTQGVTAGQWRDGSNVVHGFVRAADGTIASFDAEHGAAETYALAINDKGVIAGYCSCGGTEHGFVRTADGTVTLFDPPGSTRTYAVGINTKGEITGSFVPNTGVESGFVRIAAGKISVFDVPPKKQTYPTAVNDSGEVAGYYIKGSGAYGFLRGK